MTASIKNAVRLVAVEAEAERYGLHAGQTLSDARALVPSVVAHASDNAAIEQLRRSIALWCGRYTPLVAFAGTEEGARHYALFLDITGCAHLFGGENDMANDIMARLVEQGFTVTMGLADTPGASWALAHHGESTDDIEIVGSGLHEEAVMRLPLAALRLPIDTVNALQKVGLRSVGCIASLPRAPLAARFGPLLLRRLDQALGHEEEPISPIMPVAELSAERRFADPIVQEEDILEVVSRLAENLKNSLEKRGLGLTACLLALYRADGELTLLEVKTTNPVRDPFRVRALFQERLAALHDDLDAGFGFDMIRLGVTAHAPFINEQENFTGNGATAADYQALIDRLGARLGTERIRQFHLSESHLPERRLGTISVLRSGAAANVCNPVTHKDEEVATRPLLLLHRPEPVEVMAEVPEGAPIRFTWRRARYEIVHAEGPERIACEWWREGRGSHTRDYFRVEDCHGHRFWLFRHGLYERETVKPHWYMHGLFA